MYPLVDLSFELVLVDKAVDLYGAEEVADAFADAAGRPQSFTLGIMSRAIAV